MGGRIRRKVSKTREHKSAKVNGERYRIVVGALFF